MIQPKGEMVPTHAIADFTVGVGIEPKTGEGLIIFAFTGEKGSKSPTLHMDLEQAKSFLRCIAECVEYALAPKDRN